MSKKKRRARRRKLVKRALFIIGAVLIAAICAAVIFVFSLERQDGVGGSLRDRGIETEGSAGDREESEAIGSIGDREETETNGSIGDREENETNGSIGDREDTEANGTVSERDATEAGGAVSDRDESEAGGSVRETGETGSSGTEESETVRGMPEVIELAEQIICIERGGTAKVGAAFGGYEAQLEYKCSNKAVATVSADGTITANSEGSAFIAISAPNGAYARCIVSVMGQPDAWWVVKGDLKVLFMDVGRNDGILLECGGEYAYIDSGGRSEGAQAVERMEALGIDHLKYYIGTHMHTDHIGGAPVILSSVKVDAVIAPHAGVFEYIKSAATPEEAARYGKRTAYIVFEKGKTIWLGGAMMTCLGPSTIIAARETDTKENHNSLVFRMDYGETSFLFTGDSMDSDFEVIAQENAKALDVDVFKNPHHNGKQKEWLIKTVRPKITVFSNGKNDGIAADYVHLLTENGSALYSTSPKFHSDVMVISDGIKLRVETKKTATLTKKQ